MDHLDSPSKNQWLKFSERSPEFLDKHSQHESIESQTTILNTTFNDIDLWGLQETNVENAQKLARRGRILDYYRLWATYYVYSFAIYLSLPSI